MSDINPPQVTPVSEVVTALIERGISTSLDELDRALVRWRGGELSALEAHDAVIRHANGAEALVKRVVEAAQQPEGVIRDAFDAGLITAQRAEDLAGRPPTELTPASSLVDPGPAAPDKKAVIEDLLGRGPVLVHFDARRFDVRVPPRFRTESKLVLRFGYALTPPIPDLFVDDSGISGTLTFAGMPFGCFVPWAAVYAAVIDGDQRGMVWPDDIPEELLQTGGEGVEVTQRRGSAPSDGAKPSVRAKRPNHLKLVE